MLNILLNAIKLLNDSKMVKKDLNIKFVWPNGFIFARKHKNSDLFRI
jgi:hypothetical protein